MTDEHKKIKIEIRYVLGMRGLRMVNKTIYGCEDGKKRLADYYETYLGSLNIEFEREFVETRFGKTHVLVAGPKDGKPLFIFQGGNCINPMTLAWFAPLLTQYRVFAPDTIGHPGFSAETRLSGKDNSYALWILDLMDHLKVKKAAFAGSSFGGGIILRLATFHPEKIACAILFSPAGLIVGSKIKLIREILIPMLLFKRNGSKKHMNSIAHTMSDGKMKKIDSEIIGEIFRSVKLEQDMPKLTTKKELQNFSSPTMIIGGTKDIFFPVELLIEKAKKVIPNLTKHHIYEMGHFPAKENLKQINKEMSNFLKQHHQ